MDPQGFILGMLKKHRLPFLSAVILLALETSADLMQPTLMAQLVNRGVLERNLGALAFWGTWMVALVALGALSALGRNWLSSRVSQKFAAEVRDRAFAHVMAFRYDQVRTWDASAILTRLTFDVTQVQNLTNGLMRVYMKAPLLGLGALILAFALDPALALLILPLFPVVALLFWGQVRRALPLYEKSQGLLDELNARVRDFLHGIRFIKAFGRQKEELQGFSDVNEDLTSVNTRVLRIQAAFSPAVALTVSAVIVTVLWIGGVRAGQDPRLVGHLMAFVQYLSQILFSLLIISNLVGLWSRARTSAGRIGELMALDPAPVPERQASGGPLVVFDSVGFSYGGAPVLHGISFTLGPGQRLGIIGSTGSGKTTLLHLLLGLIPPAKGNIYTDEAGNPAFFGYVPQKPMLFQGTLRENLLAGNSEASVTDLEAALRLADAYDFVLAMPEGLDTQLGPGGVNLSGGQKQRITLARALVRRPSLLVLDEASSALDLETEARIEARLAAAYPEMSVVVVAQKVSSLADCHSILVLDEGRAAGWGTHRELLGSSEVYRQICGSQGLEPTP